MAHLSPGVKSAVTEALANGAACQQVTLTLGIRLLNGLAENYGAAIAGSDLHAFPMTDKVRAANGSSDFISRGASAGIHQRNYL